MKKLVVIALLIMAWSCGEPKKNTMCERTVKSLKTGRIYEYRIHALQKKDDIILIQDPWEHIIQNGKAKYDSVIVLDDPEKD